MRRSLCILFTLLTLIAGATARESLSFGGRKAEPSERGQIVERLRVKYQDVLERLNRQDPGANTLADQKEIADLLKQLLKQDDQPSQSNPPPNPPPAPKAPPTNTPPVQESTKPNTTPRFELAKPNTRKVESSATSLDEMKKNLNDDGYWPPKLPPRHRDDLDIYGRGRFMPRYEELLREYYRTIAEGSHGKREE